jgi:predicted transposase YdaD
VVRETKEIVDNGFEEVYVNTQIRDNSEVSELMEIFVDDNAYNSKFPKTSDGKHRYKETEGGLNSMCEIMDRLTTEARAEGRNEGKTEGRLETLFDLVKDGMLTIAEAAKRADMTEAIFTENMKRFKT